MTNEQIVKEKYPLAESYQRISNGIWDIWKSYGSREVLMDGDTEEDAWQKTAGMIEYHKVDRREEIMNGLIKQLTGQ